MSAGLVVAFGVAVGTLAGVLALGGGALIIPFFTFAGGLAQQEAAATSLCLIVPSALVSGRLLARDGVGDLGRALAVGTVVAAGAVAGAMAALALPEATVRLAFAAFLAALGLRMLRAALRPGRAFA